MAATSAAPAPSPGRNSEGGEHAVLLVESDPGRGRELFEQLRADGYRTSLARSHRHARTLAHGHPIDAVVLGTLDTPRGALDLLAEIRHGDSTHTTSALRHPDPARRTPELRRGDTRALPAVLPWDECLPVLVLGDSYEPLDLLRAFEAGADDFLAPWDGHSYLELRARLKALLRRSACPHRARVLRVGAVEVDTSAHQVRVDGAPLALSRLEYELLVQLARDPHHVHSKGELKRAVWGHGSPVGTRTVDSHASRLRRKLEAAGAPGLVVNVWRVGYRLI